jgi:hypothetical protein
MTMTAQKFLARQPDNDNTQIKDYLARYPDAPLSIEISSHSIYPFRWGFVTEQDTPFGLFWLVFSQYQWQQGNPQHLYDAFLTAYKNILEPLLVHWTKESGGLISFDDGISTHSAMSFASMDNYPKAREFFGHAILGRMDDLMEKVLNGYKFPRQWHCF